MEETDQAYEAEQRKLQAQYEGASAPDIRIEVPREPEVNPQVYKDVEPVLFRGFITVSAEINGVQFVFKSLNHHEYELLRFSGVFGSERASSAAWSVFLSYGVFMVDGINILPKREDWVGRLADVFDSMTVDGRSKIVRHLAEINRRAAKTIPLVECYAMETASRYRWLQLRGLDFTSTAVTGIEGTAKLGLNWSQQLWRAINQLEDRNDEHEREWEHAKFIGSCFAGKGLAKVYGQDAERRRKDREERAARKDRILREVLLGEKPLATPASVVPGSMIVAPRTLDELADQLRKDLRGEKDQHDAVVDAYEARVRAKLQERQAQLASAAAETQRKFGGQNIVATASLEGMTAAQVEERARLRKQHAAQAAARLRVPDQQTSEFLDKWGLLQDEE